MTTLAEINLSLNSQYYISQPPSICLLNVDFIFQLILFSFSPFHCFRIHPSNSFGDIYYNQSLRFCEFISVSTKQKVIDQKAIKLTCIQVIICSTNNLPVSDLCEIFNLDIFITNALALSPKIRHQIIPDF